jgi:hypothetical protein
MIRPTIETALAMLFSACAAASALYSPMLLLAIITRRDDWRFELLGPQIERVPSTVHTSVTLAFLLLAAVLCVNVCAGYPEWTRVAKGGCALGAVAVAGYWFFVGPLGL